MSGNRARGVLTALLLTLASAAAVSASDVPTSGAPTTSPFAVNLTIAMTSSTFTVGSTAGTYTVNVSNVGATASSGTITVTDTLPVGITYTAKTGSNWTVTWNAGTRILVATSSTSIPGNTAGQALVLTVSVGATAYPSVSKIAHVTGGGDNSVNNNTGSITTSVAGPSLQISKTGPSSFTETSSAAYTITLTNTGTDVSAGTITVRDTLPAGMTFVSATGSGWTITNTAGVVVATSSAAIAVSGTSSFTITVTPGSSAVPSVTNRAWVSGGNDATDAFSSLTTTVNPFITDLTIAVTSPALTQYSAGTYTVTVTNSGPATSSGTITTVDTLPAGLIYTSASGAGWSFTQSGQVVSGSFTGTLASGATAPYTIGFTPGAGVAASITDRAYVAGGSDAVTTNNSGTTTTAVTRTPDLTLSKTSSTFANGSTTATYSLIVANGGGAASTGTVTITDTLPVGVTYTARTGNNWTVSYAAGTRVVTATNATAINAGASAQTLVLTVTIGSAAVPSVTNTAWVSGGGDAVTTNNSAAVTTTVDAADLTVSQTPPGSFTQGSNGTYTITVQNAGALASSGTITVYDTLPAGMTFVSGAGTGWTVTNTAGVVVATSSTVVAAGGTSNSFTITVTPGSGTVPSVTNRVWVSGGSEVNTANDVATATTTVNAVVDLTISEVAGTLSQYLPGAYTISVTNNGATASSGTITVRDTLPALFTYSSATGSGWSFSNTGQVVVATYAGSLAGGASSSFTLNADVGMAAPTVTNNVYLTGGSDATAGNNSQSITTAVTQRPNFIVFDTIVGSFAYGVNNQISLNIYNSGNAPSFGQITMVDTLPVGIAYVSNNNANWTVTYNAGTRVVTATSSIVIPALTLMTPLVLTVSIGAAAYPSVTNRLWITGGGDVKDNGDGSTTIVTAADLELTLGAPSGFVQTINNTYTYGIANVGSAASSGTITVRDTLPTGMTYVSGAGTGWTITGTNNVVVATRTTAIAASGTAPFTVTVTPGAAAVPSVTNKAVLTGGNELIASNDTSIVTTPVTVGVIDLALTKTSPTFAQFSNGTYSFSITNGGTIASSGTITVLDTLPANLTFVSGSGSGWSFSASGQVVTATNSGSVAVSGTTTFTITAAVGGSAASITNRAYLSGGGDVTTGNNTGTATTTVTQMPDITPTLTSSTPFTNLATNETFTVNVANAGGASTSGTITVTDTLPVGITYVSFGGNKWSVSYNAGTRVITATNTTAAAAGANTQALVLTVSVASAAYPSVTNTVWVSGGGDANGANNSSSTVATILAPDLTITKQSPASFAQGLNAAYTITLTNIGSAATTGTITVRDTLPTGMTFVSATGTNWTLSGTNNVVVGTRTIAIAANGTSAITVTVTPQASAVPSVTNKAVLTGGGDANAANDTARVTTPVTSGTVDLSITNTSPAFAQFSSNAYTVTVTNGGTAASFGTIQVTDTLPANVTYTSATGTGWTFSNTGQVVIASYAGSIAASGTAPFTINVDIGAAAASITDRAFLSGGGDATAGNNTGTATTAVTLRADLSLTKTSSTPFTYGSVTETFTLVAQNNGGAATSGTITITDTLPAGIAYISKAGANWTVSYNAGTRVVTATSATVVNAGASAQSLVLTVSVGAAAYPSGTNTAWVSGGGDSYAANNSGSTAFTVIAPDLSIAATVSPSTFSQGSNGVYTVTVTNVGTLATSGTITVLDTLPAGMAYVIGTGTNWTFTNTGNVVVATNTTAIAVNGTSTFTLAAKPGAASVPVITNKMVVSGGNQINLANDTTYNTTNVTGTTVVVDLTVGVAASSNFQQNYTGTYTITVSNPGTAASGGTITVVDTLPTGLTYSSASGSGWSISAVGQVVTATYSASIAASGSAAFTVTANVALAAVPSITDRAFVAGGGDSNTANNGSGNVTTTVSGIPSVTVLASTSPSVTATPGQVITYTYNFVNGGNGPAVSVRITSNLPAQVQFVLGSTTATLPGGVTATVEYSNGSVWTYTPVSGGCGAAAGYDNCVTTVRWTLQQQLAASATGSVSLGARVK